MAYEWYWEHCHPEITSERFPKGVPHCKLAPVTLEKNGELKKFRTQEEVDLAWGSGWHERGKPETADVHGDTVAIVDASPPPKPKGGPMGRARGRPRRKVE